MISDFFSLYVSPLFSVWGAKTPSIYGVAPSNVFNTVDNGVSVYPLNLFILPLLVSFLFQPDVEYNICVVFPCVSAGVGMLICPVVTAPDHLFSSGGSSIKAGVFRRGPIWVLRCTDLKNDPRFNTGRSDFIYAEFTFSS